MINSRILEQVSHFNYLEIDTGYDANYIDFKLGKLRTMYGKINRIVRNKFYGCEVWTTTKKNELQNTGLRNAVLKRS